MRTLAYVLVAGLAAWVSLIVVAPVAIAASPRSAVAVAASTYAAGSLVCHQQATRSFRIGGRQMPVCARCTGLYVSALVGGVVALVGRRRRIGVAARWVIVAVAVPTVVSWALDYSGATHTSNALRFAIALPLGVVAGWVVIALTREPGSGLKSDGWGQI